MTTGFNRWKACRFGVMLYNINDRYVGQSLEHYGEYSFGESDVFRQIVRPGDVVVDVGANIGAHTLQFAQLAGPTGEVHAFEPQRLVFQALCANMALNSITNARCYPFAVGREPGTILVPFLEPSTVNNFGGVSLIDRSAGDRTAVTTVDALGLKTCRMIKIDVEGMEREVILGAEETIRRTRPYLYVENDRESKEDDLIQTIAGLGYDLYRHKPPLFNRDNYLKNAENIYGNVVSLNLLCVPRTSGLVVEGSARIVPSGGAGRTTTEKPTDANK
jgi:FkbM family methyltransferase